MMNCRALRVLFLISALALTGCSDGGTSPENASLTGKWIFPHQDPTYGNRVELTLTETANGSISGSGQVQNSGGPTPVSVTGLHSQSSVSLNVTGQYCSGGFSGQVTDRTTIKGTFAGNCTNGTWILSRQ